MIIVVPAKAGTHFATKLGLRDLLRNPSPECLPLFLQWIPAYAGMTRGWLRRKEKNIVVRSAGMTQEVVNSQAHGHRRPCEGRDPSCNGARAGKNISKQISVEVPPLGVYPFNQADFPEPFPALELFFAGNCRIHFVM